jgi:DNA-binding transcriptional regulator LsrR (DeoR family)
MFAVEIYAAVRWFVFVEGKSRREAARDFGLSRDTISKMCRYSAPPGYVRSKAPERSAGSGDRRDPRCRLA